MSISCKTEEITKTISLHFDSPIYAVHPKFSNQELAFTEAKVTLCAEWDKKTQSWKPKRTADGKIPRIELHAPNAKRVDYYGELQKADAFHFNGKLNPLPIPLASIVKKGWFDETEEKVRNMILDAFWKPLLTA